MIDIMEGRVAGSGRCGADGGLPIVATRPRGQDRVAHIDRSDAPGAWLKDVAGAITAGQRRTRRMVVVDGKIETIERMAHRLAARHLTTSHFPAMIGSSHRTRVTLTCVKVVTPEAQLQCTDEHCEWFIVRWRIKMLRIIVASFLIAGLSGASWADDITYRKHIRPLMAEKCLFCHGADAPYLGEFEKDKTKFEAMLKGPRMDTYADLIFFIGWPDTGAIMRRLDDGKGAKNGKPGNMYQRLGATEEERQKNLNLFKQWVGKDAWKLNRWAARGDVPAISKEDLDKIKVEY